MNNVRQLTRAILPLVVFLLLLAAVMFVPAGLGWWQGWLFLAVFALQIVADGSLYLAHKPRDFRRPEQDAEGNEGLGSGALLLSCKP